MSLYAVNNSTLKNPDRYLGGSDVASYHPYVKGYFYVFYELPPIVSNYDNKIKQNASITLLSLCEGFTPPGDRQLKTEDVTGIGGIDASFVVGQTIDRNFSLMYRDIWGSPIFKYHRAWTSIVDPFLGGMVRDSEHKNLQFVPSTYKGKILVIQTKPIALKMGNPKNIFSGSISDKNITEDDIIKVHLFDGVVPTTDLNSVYDANINDNSIVRPTIQYRFDGKEYDETVAGMKTIALARLNSLTISRQSASITPTNSK